MGLPQHAGANAFNTQKQPVAEPSVAKAILDDEGFTIAEANEA